MKLRALTSWLPSYLRGVIPSLFTAACIPKNAVLAYSLTRSTLSWHTSALTLKLSNG